MSHLSYVEAVVTGLVQGVSELFPISSLGHNVLLPALLGGQWAKDLSVSAPGSPYLAFIVGLHVATALAIILFFWRDWLRIIKGFFSSLKNRKATTPDERLAWMIILATIPVGIVGLLAQKLFTKVFATPDITAIFLAVNGIVLLYSERVRRTRGTIAAGEPAMAGSVAMARGAGMPGTAQQPGGGGGGWNAGPGPDRTPDVPRGGFAGRGVGPDRGGYDGGPGGYDGGPGGYDGGPGGYNSGRGGYDAGQDGYDDGRGYGGRAGYDDGGRGGHDSGRGGYDGNSQEPPSWQQQPGQQQWQGPDPRYEDPRYGQDEPGQGPRFTPSSPSSPQDQTQQYEQQSRGGAPWGGGQDPRYPQGGGAGGPSFTPSGPADQNPQYGSPQYDPQQYGRGQQFDQTQQYGAPQHGGPKHGGPQHGGPQHGGPQYPAPQYPAPQYGGPQGGQPQGPYDGGRGGQGPWQPGGQPGPRAPEPWQPRQPAGGPARPFTEQPEGSDAVTSDRRLAAMTYKKGIGIGTFQIAALLSGISRDGIVTVGGMLLGVRRQDAVRFSFLLSAPVILAAGVLKLHDLFGPQGKGIHGPVVVGSLLAFIAAYLSVRFLTKYFSEDKSLKPFGIYCIAAGVLSLAYLVLVK